MKADTILTIGIITVIIGVIMFNNSGFRFLPISLIGLLIICIAIIKQNDKHKKW